ncbi:nucleotidyltransferase family protein [Pedobacter frigidisoli]|uniref:nucleotidyltransferase family protein n=1 Tax=Pedobacter frigidisoli TaxID=2530455 RepID=UPI00292EE4B5|nr:nucleotidyltransferase family protein [Pedobacter frigidisoli]
MDTGIIILAAGNSSRMGKPKQLLLYKGQTLLDIAVTAALNTAFRPVVVVLGAYSKEILDQPKHPEVRYAVNQNWEQGMSSSIAFGLQTALTENPRIENVILTVADQVHISGSILEDLHKMHQSAQQNIITCSYGQTTGTPALFNKKHFGELLTLNGTNGAKSLINQYIEDVAVIPFEMGEIDVDTVDDYNNLINSK